jgi:hypothetical protein
MSSSTIFYIEYYSNSTANIMGTSRSRRVIKKKPKYSNYDDIDDDDNDDDDDDNYQLPITTGRNRKLCDHFRRAYYLFISR